jgi:hypothetical protein
MCNPSPAWYLYTNDASSVRPLTDDGEPSPELDTELARTLAELTAMPRCSLGLAESHHFSSPCRRLCGVSGV